MTPREAVEAHAEACWQPRAGDAPVPVYAGPPLTGADLTGARLTGTNLARADLTGADLTGARLSLACLAGARLSLACLAGARLAEADLTGAHLTGARLAGARLTGACLTGADLTGARLDEGVARGVAIGGRHGGYTWWAVRLADGAVLLQYGCECHLLDWWRQQGPELSVRHERPASHWEEGPMVAIAAAEALLRGEP